MNRLCKAMGLAILVAACWWVVAGCESTSTTDSVMTITAPTGALPLTASNRTVVLTANLQFATNRTAVLPLTWSVSDQSLGTIKQSEALSAVYESTGTPGNNTVTVRDQTYAEGILLIPQQ